MWHYRDVPLGWVYFAAGVEPGDTPSTEVQRAFVLAALRGMFLPSPIPFGDGEILPTEAGEPSPEGAHRLAGTDIG